MPMNDRSQSPAESPSNRQTIYSSRDYPGCMGGIVHLFDFNQALSGRKLLTDKKFGESLEAPRKSFDVGGSIPEVLKSNTGVSEEIPYGYEFRKASGSKKSSGMPIKALIAQELSKEPEPRNRAPSVVARLMGLDALPAESKAVQKAPKTSVEEKTVLKAPLERRFHEDLPPYSAKLLAKKTHAPSVQRVPDPFASKSSHFQGTDWEDDGASFESLPFRNHPQEQQLREFKKEFEARQSQRLDHPRSARLEGFDSQLSAKQMIVRQKLREAKLVLSQEKCSNSKHSAPQERLHESKEFLDAMDFLQSNKDFFIRFLQEPNSLFARHLQDNQVDFVPAEPVQAVKHRRSHRIPDSLGSRSEEYVSQSREKETPELRRKYRSEEKFQKSLGADLMMERNLVKSSTAPSLGNEMSLRLPDRQMHNSSPLSSDNRASSADCHVPTRIVVLKPSPGRARNFKSLSSIYPGSPKDYADAKEVIREDSKYVLQELRERLRKDSRESYKHERKNTRPSTNEHYRDITKDPREIAREIARQVRENVTRDLMVDSGRFRSASATSSGSRTQSSRLASEAGDITGSSDGETCAPRRFYWDHDNRSTPTIPRRTKNVDVEPIHGSREGKRASERSRSMNVAHADKPFVQSQNSTLRKVIYSEDSRQSSPGSKSSRSSRASGQHSVDGINVNQNHRRILFHMDTDRDDDVLRIDVPPELEVSPSFRNGEESKESPPKTSLRSCPAAVIAAAVDGSREELLPNVHLCEISEAGLEKVVDTTAVDLSTGAATLKMDTSTRSNFSRKNSVSKGSSSLSSRKQAARNERIEIFSFPSEESPSQEDASTTNQRDQCQIEDIGPVLDNGGSVSSLENFNSLEAALNLEDSLGGQGLVTQQFEIRLPTDKASFEKPLEFEDQENTLECEHPCNESIASNKDSDSSVHSLSASPQRLSYLGNDAPTSANTELTKEECEQPSPVSVLDVPFQEETASPMGFKEISSDLQELRRRLQLLKVGDHEPEPDFETMQDEDYVVADENGSKNIDCYSPTVQWQFPVVGFEHSNFVMDEMDCSSGKGMEMVYAKDVLVAAGFTGDSTAILTRWYAPSQPLDPCLFQKMEGSYSSKESEIQVHAETTIGTGQQWGGLSVSSKRRLLFDMVNEVLLEALGPYLNLRRWLHPSKLPLFPMPCGKDLVKLVWTEVCHKSCSQSEAQDTLESLVTKDLAKGGNWIDLRVDSETVGLELESTIFNDLIEETLLVL